ncbi:MAG: 1-acyl-sn-glycerol-3-phosphate acyltransferase [Acidimicrobiales bacterium]|nr:1-acyl-sn-glycerol-3-phosphate acyltransferase [Acidimicrobiales bacterium]
MTERKGLERLVAAGASARRRVPSARSATSKLEFPFRAPSVPETITPEAETPTTGAHYDTAWARRLPARYARFFVTEGLMRPALAAVAQPERRGLDRLDGLDGPVIFAANHHSHLDGGLLITSLPERFRHTVFAGAAADYFFKTKVSGAAAALALNAIPIERSKVTRRSADQAAQLLAEGWSMVIFPEGGRSPDGWGQAFRGGAAYLAIRGQVPVVPVHLQGTGRIFPKGAKTIRPGRTVVTFGRPLRPAEGETSQRFSTRLEAEVAALADEATSDWYAARVRAHAGTSPDLGGPDAGAWRRAWALGDRRRRSRPTAPRWPDLG